MYAFNYDGGSLIRMIFRKMVNMKHSQQSNKFAFARSYLLTCIILMTETVF